MLQLPSARICLLKELSPAGSGGSVRVTGEVKEVQPGQCLILHDRGATLQVDASSLIRPVSGIMPGVHVQAVGELEGPQLLLISSLFIYL
eukprot:s697_g16.t1